MAQKSENPGLECDTRKRWALEAERFPPPYLNPWLRLAIYGAIATLTGTRETLAGTAFIAWAGIRELLYKAGTFESLCDATHWPSLKIRGASFTNCPDRAEAINQLFTIAFSTNIFCCIFSGAIHDFFGQKFCFVAGCLVNFACWILLGLFPTNGALLRGIFFVFGLFAESVYLPLTTGAPRSRAVALYFPAHKPLILSILSCCRTLSFVLPTCLSYIFLSHRLDPRDFYAVTIVYAIAVHFACGLLGFFIIQRNFFEKPLALEDAELPPGAENDPISPLEFLKQRVRNLSSKISRGLVLEGSAFGLSAALYTASVQMINMTHRQIFVTSDGRSAVELFRYAQILSFIPGFVFGILVDIIGSRLSFLVMQIFVSRQTAQTLVSAVLVGFDSYAAKIAAAVLYNIGSSIFLSIIILYVVENYPPEILGVSLGFVLLFCGTAVVINIPLYGVFVGHFDNKTQFLRISWVLLAYGLVSIAVNVATLLIRWRRRLRRKALPPDEN